MDKPKDPAPPKAPDAEYHKPKMDPAASAAKEAAAPTIDYKTLKTPESESRWKQRWAETPHAKKKAFEKKLSDQRGQKTPSLDTTAIDTSRARAIKSEEMDGDLEKADGALRPLAKWKASRDLLPGGKGDNATDAMFDPKEVELGHAVEQEHTQDPNIAGEISRDHLSEDPQYYSKLNDAGLVDERSKEPITIEDGYRMRNVKKTADKGAEMLRTLRASKAKKEAMAKNGMGAAAGSIRNAFGGGDSVPPPPPPPPPPVQDQGGSLGSRISAGLTSTFGKSELEKAGLAGIFRRRPVFTAETKLKRWQKKLMANDPNRLGKSDKKPKNYKEETDAKANAIKDANREAKEPSLADKVKAVKDKYKSFGKSKGNFATSNKEDIKKFTSVLAGKKPTKENLARPENKSPLADTEAFKATMENVKAGKFDKSVAGVGIPKPPAAPKVKLPKPPKVVTVGPAPVQKSWHVAGEVPLEKAKDTIDHDHYMAGLHPTILADLKRRMKSE